MIGLYISLATLGLLAIDPIGIAVMTVLLVQKRPYKRSFVFLLGSFISLILMGLLFSKGLGRPILNFENSNSWFVPTIEVVAAVILLIVALTLFVQFKAGNNSAKLSSKELHWLELGSWQLFGLGALLVAVQSVIDVVFIVAMVRAGQFNLSNASLLLAIFIYALMALILQIIIVIVFRFAPSKQKTTVLYKVNHLVLKYSNQVLIIVSLMLSLVLFGLAILR